MKRSFFTLIIFALILITITARATTTSKNRILIFGKTIRPAHAPIIPLAGAALTEFLSKNGFQVSFIEDSGELDSAHLSDYQSLVLLDVSEGTLSSDEKKSVELFFEQGGGIVAIHSSISAGKDWPWFRALVGTSFLDHAPIQPGTIRITMPDDPANRDLPLRWEQSDEWYNFSSQIGAPKKVLATADESTFQGGNMGTSHPITWSFDSGKGKFWYTALGHSASLYVNSKDAFSQMLLQAVRWTSKQGDLKGDR